MEKPDVDAIEGLSPAISIEQKTAGANPRSTVGTITEVYDYLRLLWARTGTPHCPKDGTPVERQSASQITDLVLQWPEAPRSRPLAPWCGWDAKESSAISLRMPGKGICPRAGGR